MIALILLSAYPAALLIAAFNDLAEFKIPNWASAVLFVSFFGAAAAVGAPGKVIIEGLLLACAALVIGFALFARRVFGGGDAKLFAALAPWIGVAGFLSFLLNVAVAGGFLAMFLLLFRQTPALPVYAQAPWLLRLHQRPKDIPYAVAICIGGLMSFPATPLFRLWFEA